MRRMHHGVVLLCVSATVALGGCGSGTLTSGLPPETSLRTLDDADALALCETLSESYRVFEDHLCAAEGAEMLIQTGDQASCESTIASCEWFYQGNTERLVEEAKAACIGVTAAELVGIECDATVREWEGCLNESLANIEARASSLSCGDDPAEFEGGLLSSRDTRRCDAYIAQGCISPGG